MYPVLIDLGWWQFRSYGVFVAVALLVGIWWSMREGERRGFPRAVIQDFAWVVVLAGLVGARLYYVVVTEPQFYLANPWQIFAVWQGGLSMHGGLIAGAVAAIWFIRRRRLPFWRFADAVIPGVILGQAVGQIACLLNGDTYGKPTTVAWAITFTDPAAMAPLGVPLHPIQVYELLAYAAVFFIVHRMARSTAREGSVLAVYAISYGIARFIMEFFRGDPPMIAGIIVPQVVSVLLVVGGILGMLLIRQGSWKARESVAR